MNDVRAHAAKALAAVVDDGASLRAVMARNLPTVADPRDRALLTALASEGARWWLRYEPALAGLLSKPLPRREAAVRALLVLGLVQLEVLSMPAYAAVAATVQAMRALGRERYAGLANAVLRRWLRERKARLARLDAEPGTRHAMPAWLLQALRADWPGDFDALLAAGNQAPAPTLRVNRRHGSRDAYRARLVEAGIEAAAQPWLPDALVLAHNLDVRRLPGFADGDVSVQDGAAQAAVGLLAAGAGQRVLDACAAPGGKTAHLLEGADLDLLALDSDATRLERVGENLARLGLRARLCEGDAGARDWWDGRPFQRILLDAPCSATGVIRRHPDIKLHRRASDIPALAAAQAQLLANLWPMLAPGGRLLYATCSVLRAENEAVLMPFLAANRDARAATPDCGVGRRAGPGWQFLPGDDGVDGMFYAVLEKHGEAKAAA
ncbi:MAG TPA: 16S rRNA (cytosine(967)-C(5))-methyltransferase RsmB [Rhodanobacteraceae bacterium]|nr:16S rRNA (cytosine(967)-C(5))-methyltransferase RsmB [Rhodanobacteraceae bacterium]